MKKYFRYIKIFTVSAMLLGFAGAAFSDAGADREPNAPVEDRELVAVAEAPEPNNPAETQEPNTPAADVEPNSIVEDLQLKPPAERRDPAGLSKSWDTYRIVVERNIFSRQRGPRRERMVRQVQVPVAPPAPDPESYVVLKGIVQEDGEFIAFLEDTQTGQVVRVRQGDSVVRGKIKALTLDSIEYEYADRTTTVTMGSNLQGGMGGAVFTGTYDLSQTYSTTSERGTTEPSSPPTEDEAEILRQLMERRQQQIGQ